MRSVQQILQSRWIWQGGGGQQQHSLPPFQAAQVTQGDHGGCFPAKDLVLLLPQVWQLEPSGGQTIDFRQCGGETLGYRCLAALAAPRGIKMVEELGQPGCSETLKSWRFRESHRTGAEVGLAAHQAANNWSFLHCSHEGGDCCSCWGLLHPPLTAGLLILKLRD